MRPPLSCCLKRYQRLRKETPVLVLYDPWNVYPILRRFPGTMARSLSAREWAGAP